MLSSYVLFVDTFTYNDQWVEDRIHKGPAVSPVQTTPAYKPTGEAGLTGRTPAEISGLQSRCEAACKQKEFPTVSAFHYYGERKISQGSEENGGAGGAGEVAAGVP